MDNMDLSGSLSDGRHSIVGVAVACRYRLATNDGNGSSVMNPGACTSSIAFLGDQIDFSLAERGPSIGHHNGRTSRDLETGQAKRHHGKPSTSRSPSFLAGLAATHSLAPTLIEAQGPELRLDTVPLFVCDNWTHGLPVVVQVSHWQFDGFAKKTWRPPSWSGGPNSIDDSV